MLPRDTSDYFYYGQINESVIEEINSDESKTGLFILSNIRYWDDNDLLQVYENNKFSGNKIFRIQAIQHLILFKDDPINLFDTTELHETAKELRNIIEYPNHYKFKTFLFNSYNQ